MEDYSKNLIYSIKFENFTELMGFIEEKCIKHAFVFSINPCRQVQYTYKQVSSNPPPLVLGRPVPGYRVIVEVKFVYSCALIQIAGSGVVYHLLASDVLDTFEDVDKEGKSSKAAAAVINYMEKTDGILKQKFGVEKFGAGFLLGVNSK